MMPKFVISVLLLYTTCIFYHGIGATFTNFEVKRFEVCNNTQLQFKYYSHITKKNGKQYLTHNATFPYPVGDNIGFLCLIQSKTVGKNFIELFTVREKSFCKAMNKYVGEFWYDIERQSLMAPGVCPMQQGTFHGQNIELHFEKITLQTFPFGTLRFTLQGIDNVNKNSVWCLFLEVDNVVN